MDPLHHSTNNPIPKYSFTTEQLNGATTDLTMIKEHNDESDGILRKQYENMTYDEMSQRIAENYKQLSNILETHDTTPSSTSSDKTNSMEGDRLQLLENDGDDDSLDEQQIVDNNDLDETTKKRKVNRLFWRAASSGDSNKVQALLQNDTLKTLVDIDAKDEDGTTPLIYAACFGKVDIAQILLSFGAKIDIQDSFGWSALMWATNNNHEQIVKLLLESGASSQTKSSKGRTVFDFVNTENQKIVDILATNHPRDSVSSTSSIFDRNNGSLSSSSTLSHTGDYDFYYQSTLEGYDNFMTEEADRRKKLLKAAMHIGGTNNDDHDDLDDPTLNQYDDEDTHDISNDFQWDKCLPDQMFVFGGDDLPHILDTIITNIQLPMPSQHEICLPANVIFLSARFAHYFATEELLNQVLNGALERISNTIKANTRNIHVLAFWITNLTQLLHYLKKDGGLVVAAANHQLQLSELISETYMTLINDTEQRIAKILDPAMLEHEEIPGMDQVKFSDDWQRFFRRNSRRSMIVPPGGALATQIKRQTSQPMNTSTSSNSSSTESVAATTKTDTKNGTISPQSITGLLSSTLFVLQSYDVHPAIVVQALAQFFHYMSCELFNRILTNKKLLCRSKAMQIRMNVSQLEDWISTNNMPINLNSYMTVTAQLLQLLQCLTQLTDLVSFINTVKTFDALNALQVKRCVTNYRYEVNEPRLPEEVEKYAMQLVEDTVRHQQTRNQRHQQNMSSSSSSSITPPPPPKKRPILRSMSRSSQQSIASQRTNSSRRESMSHLVGSLMSSMGISHSSTDSALQFNDDEMPSSPVNDMDSTEIKDLSYINNNDNDNGDDGDHKDIEETRDSKFMLPFSVPTSSSIDQQHQKFEHTTKERLRVPVIPEDWMNKLDHGHTSI